MLFIIVISISMFVVGLSYSIVSHHLTPEYIARQFLVNLPFGIALGFADWWIISRVYRQRLFRSNAMRVVVDILLTTIVSAVVTACLNYLILWGENSIFIVVANSFAVVPCNWIIVLQIELYIYHQQQAATARQLEIIEKERALYQFEVLKNQINPHFLFNSLNILASLAYQDADKTNSFAKKLSQVYRYILSTHGRPTVTLDEELRFLDSYLYLEKIRFDDTLNVNISETAGQRHRQVVPASIQMLVENALKHNINTRRSPLIIDIDISSDAVTVTNNIQPRAHSAANGTGLENLQRQYELYDKHICVSNANGMFSVRIPFV